MMHRPRKRFGQNFLHDSQVITEIISMINAQCTDHIVEIGPGKGALTEFLIGQCQQLDIIELDRDLVAVLNTRFTHVKDLQIHCADVLNVKLDKLLAGAEDKLRIVGNLPYNISTPLLFHLLGYSQIIDDMHFMLQKEVVNRICAKPGSKTYGRLSVMIQYHCRVHKIIDVEAESFTPKPKVASAVLRLIPHQHSDIRVKNLANFKDLVGRAFSQRRKTIRNSLRPLLSEDEMRSVNVNPNARAETLTISEFAQLSNLCERRAKYEETVPVNIR